MDAFADFIAAALRIGTPLLLAAKGELILERSGVLNIGIEGVMLCGAFFGFWAGWASGSPFVGVMVAIPVGALVGLLLAFLVLRVKADQIVAGMGINLVALGLTGTLFQALQTSVSEAGASTKLAAPTFGAVLPSLSSIPFLGPVLFQQTILTWVAFGAVPLVWFYLNRSERGLELRSVGENPAAAQASGISVLKVRAKAFVFAGVFAALGGAFLTLSSTSTFVSGCTNGRGFIALAAVVLGRYTALGTAGACVFFGAAFAAQNYSQAAGLKMPSEVLEIKPYALTLVALLVASRKRSTAPASLGKPYG